jgi:hypothetical protein
MPSKRATTIRVHLSCSCGSPNAHYRYARDVEGLYKATLAWITEGGHDNPHHRQRITAESYRFAEDAKLKDRLLRRLANRPPSPAVRRRPTAEEYLTPRGTVLRRYGQ